MVDTGITRRIDDLGRICIPREVRQRIFGEMDATGQELIFFIEGNSIILKPYKSTEQIYREKVIDDFAERLKSDTMAKTFGLRMCDIDRIAEQLKGANHE